MDPEDRQTADEAVIDDNVVRLPRDWLGPRDELIPIGSSANGQSGRSEAGLPPTADDFWGEESSLLQSALEAPPRPALTDQARPVPAPVVDTPHAPGPPRRRPSRRSALAAAALACGGLVAAATAGLLGGGAQRPVARASAGTASTTYMAMAKRDLTALASWAKQQERQAARHRQRTTATRARRRTAPRQPRHVHVTRPTVVVEQVHYTAAPPAQSGSYAPASTSSSSSPPAQLTARRRVPPVSQPPVPMVRWVRHFPRRMTREREPAMSRVLGHIRSNVIAYLALFVALGGTSYAAMRLPAGSVGTRQLKNHSVTPIKLDRGSIAGYVRDYAEINAQGNWSASRPRARLIGLGATGPAPGWTDRFRPTLSPLCALRW